MNKFFSILAVASFLCLISYGQDSNYSKTLKKMFEVSGSEESYKVAIKQIFEMYKQQYPEVNSEKWDDIEKEFLKTSLTDLVDMLAPVYIKYMTVEDLNEMIKFYQTPIGTKYAKNTPLIVQESMQVGQQWGLKIAGEFEKKMKNKEY